VFEKIAERVNADTELLRRGRFVNTTFLIAVDESDVLIRVQDGRIVKVTRGPFITPDYSFALRARGSVWEKFWQPQPPAGFNDIFALIKTKAMRVEGDLHPLMSNLLYFKDVIAMPRKDRAPETAR
jgi:hypothetical protein